jgi:hypothetical protein
MKIYIYPKDPNDKETWFLSEIFGTIRHMCSKYSDTTEVLPTMESSQPCEYCGERCPDLLILATKILPLSLDNIGARK